MLQKLKEKHLFAISGNIAINGSTILNYLSLTENSHKYKINYPMHIINPKLMYELTTKIINV